MPAGEFVDLWDDSGASELRHSVLRRHFDAMKAISSASIERTHKF